MIREVLKVLLVEDNPADVLLVREMLRDASAALWEITAAGRLAEALELLGTHPYDVVLLDLGLPDSQGLAGLDRLAARFPNVPIVIMTGLGDETVGLDSIRRGAGDYLVKGQADGELIVRAIRYTIERKRVEEALAESKDRYVRLFEMESDAILLMDHETGAITEVNEAATRLYGWSRDELIVMKNTDLSAEPELTRAAAFRKETRIPLRRHRKKDGTVFPAEITFTRFNWNDRPVVLAAVRDITERINAERTLRESEAKHRLLLENMTDLVFTIDADKRLTFVSPSYCELLGRTEEDLLGRNILEFTTTEDGPMVAAAEENLRHPPNVYGLEWKVPTPDGGRWVAWLIKSVLDDNGQVKEVISVGRDVTERRHWELALRASEERFRIAAGLASDLIFEWDSQSGRVTWFGDVDRLYGYGPGEFPRDAFGQHQFIHHDDRPRFMAALERHIRTGEPFNEVYRVRRKDGSHVIISSRGVMLRDAKDGSLRWVGVNSDITAQRQAEEDVSRLNRLYEATVSTIPSSILLLDHRLHIVMANARFGREHRLDGGEAEGRPLAEVLRPESFSDPELLSRVREIAANGGDYRALGINHASELHPPMVVDIHVQGIPAPDGNHMVLLVLNDVTEATALREQLYHSHKLEAIGELAGGIAHDFNNNLIPILTYSQLMLAGMDPANPMYDDLLEIKKAADRSAALTHQLLAFGRKQKLELSVFDLNPVIAGMEKMLGRVLGENIRLETRFELDPARIKADPSQIEHVLVNLAINARDAMNDGGKLTITTRMAEVQDALQERLDLPAGNYLLLTVRDTGAGMDEETRKRIFEPFFTTKEKGKGTGLGLSTVYGIVKQSGGNILAESEPGQGSAFRIYLPMTREPAPFPRIDAAAVPVTPARILVVEDEEMVRRATARLIRHLGYEVVEAAGGQEACRICEQPDSQFDLLICDVIMPDMSGPELVHRLAELRPGLKVIYVSGYADEDIISGRDLAAAAFLEKPFSASNLAAKIRDVLS